MGKPGSSCLKIMGCGRDPEADGGADMEVAAAVEDKTTLLSDKRRWSFRRRSSRHRVLNNTSISEPFSVVANSNDATDAGSNVTSSLLSLHNSDKIATVKSSEEEPQPPSLVIVTDRKVSEDSVAVPIGDDDAKNVACSMEKPLVVVIQTAIRVYLARRELIKLKNIVKLQAVVRGHLVRIKAIGSLYCIQSIVKVQTVIRAHLMQSRKGSKIYRHETPLMGSNTKLLKNAFVCQLLDSTTSEGTININCEPTKADSTWLWLERWTTITSTHAADIQDIDSNDMFVKPSEQPAVSEVFTEVEVTNLSCAVNSKPEPRQIDSNGLSNSCIDLKVPSSRGKPDETFKFPEPSFNDGVSGVSVDSSADIVSVEEPFQSMSSQTPSLSDGTTQPERQKRVVDLEKSKRTIKRITREPQDSANKKTAVGSKRSCNPAFAAVQSKFEELSAPSAPAKSVSHATVAADEKPDMHQSQAATLLKCDRNSTEISINLSRVHSAISECDTEISITSTLDSPDRSEIEGGEIVMEIGDLEKRHFSPNGNVVHNLSNDVDTTNSEVRHSSVSTEKLEDKYNNHNGDVDATMYTLDASEAELKNSCIDENVEGQEPNKNDVYPGLSSSAVDPAVAGHQPSAEYATCNLSIKNEKSIEDEVFISSMSPEGSPRSHITIPESHGTPSSQVSANTEKSKATRKSRSQPHGKKSPSSVTNGFYVKRNIEHLPKDPNSAKRRNSLGTTKPLPVGHQPRNSSSNAIPSYMQATESARAKLMHSSPKSSPDLHDKEIYTRKRHSLPLENGKQGSSPRMQRSTSQAQQSSKGNGTVSPHSAERWQR